MSRTSIVTNLGQDTIGYISLDSHEPGRGTDLIVWRGTHRVGVPHMRRHNETLSVIAMRVHNPDSSPLLEADERERPDMSSTARHKN
jgi:hypothetical protein